MACLLFDWFGFDQTSKSVSNSTYQQSSLILIKQTAGQPYSDTSLIIFVSLEIVINIFCASDFNVNRLLT